MLKKVLSIGLLILLGGLTVRAISADELTEFGVVNINVPERNFAENPVLMVMASTANCTDTIVAYLKHDLSDYKGSEMQAEIVIYSALLEGVDNTAQLGLYAVANDAWKQSTLTWNNKPVMGERIMGVGLDDPDVEAIRFSSEALNDYLETEAAKDGTASLMLRFDQQCGASVTKLFAYGRAHENIPDYLPPEMNIEVVGDKPASSSGTGGGACAAPLFAPFFLLGMVGMMNWRKRGG